MTSPIRPRVVRAPSQRDRFPASSIAPGFWLGIRGRSAAKERRQKPLLAASSRTSRRRGSLPPHRTLQPKGAGRSRRRRNSQVWNGDWPASRVRFFGCAMMANYERVVQFARADAAIPPILRFSPRDAFRRSLCIDRARSQNMRRARPRFFAACFGGRAAGCDRGSGGLGCGCARAGGSNCRNGRSSRADRSGRE